MKVSHPSDLELYFIIPMARQRSLNEGSLKLIGFCCLTLSNRYSKTSKNLKGTYFLSPLLFGKKSHIKDAVVLILSLCAIVSLVTFTKNDYSMNMICKDIEKYCSLVKAVQ